MVHIWYRLSYSVNNHNSQKPIEITGAFPNQLALLGRLVSIELSYWSIVEMVQKFMNCKLYSLVLQFLYFSPLKAQRQI